MTPSEVKSEVAIDAKNGCNDATSQEKYHADEELRSTSMKTRALPITIVEEMTCHKLVNIRPLFGRFEAFSLSNCSTKP